MSPEIEDIGGGDLERTAVSQPEAAPPAPTPACSTQSCRSPIGISGRQLAHFGRMWKTLTAIPGLAAPLSEIIRAGVKAGCGVKAR
jgi:hypothetical protein